MEGFRKLGRKWDLVALNLTRFCLPFEISCPSLSLKKILYQDKLQAKQKKIEQIWRISVNEYDWLSENRISWIRKRRIVGEKQNLEGHCC